MTEAGNKPDSSEPSRILAIRLQAMGDVTITLPYIAALRRHYPNSRIDFLTVAESAGIPAEIEAVDRVIALRGGRNRRLQFLAALLLLPKLIAARYSLVADLQDNRISRMLCHMLRSNSNSTFDRLSPRPAGDRYQQYLEALTGRSIKPVFDLRPRSTEMAIRKFQRIGAISNPDFVVLNPAGVLPSRNWPIENYIEFAQLWLSESGAETTFLLIGVDRMAEKAAAIEAGIGQECVNLVGQTTEAEAFALVSSAKLIVSEDSGLMHMAWVCGVPTVALFGSSRSDWSRPLGPHSVCLSSADLECGECMQVDCRYGDNRCLTRHSPAGVFRMAKSLFAKLAEVQ